MKFSYWPLLFLSFFFIAIIIYSPSLSGPFQYDDYAQILDNKVLTGRPLPKLLSSVFRFTAHEDGWTGTRDFVRATFLLNWQWWGERPLGYRWTNLIIHVINAFLVSILASQLMGSLRNFSPRAQVSQTSPLNFRLPIFAGLLFLIHPLNSQAVAYVAQRFTSVATLFYLLTVILWCKAWEVCETSHHERRFRKLPYISALLSALLAYNSKEIAVTLPVALTLITGYRFSVFGSLLQVSRLSVSQSQTDKPKTGKPETENRRPKTDNWVKIIFFLLSFFLLALKIPLQTATASAAGASAEAAAAISSPLKIDLGAFALRQKEDLVSRRDYFLTQISVVATYLRLAVLPIRQTLDYDYPLTKTLDAKTIGLAALHLSLIGAGTWLLFKIERHNHSQILKNIGIKEASVPSNSSNPSNPSILNLVGFGLLWFYLTLLPESSFIPIPDVIYEHRAYLPMVGLSLAAAAIAAAGLHKSYKTYKSYTTYFFSVAAAILMILAAATMRRAYIWGNEVRLWHDVYAKAPQKPRAVKNYGVVLAASGKYDEGIKLLETAVQLDPDNADYWSNLGTANLRAGRYDVAKDKFLKAYGLLAAELGLPPYDDLGFEKVQPLRTQRLNLNTSTLPQLPEKSRRQAAQYLNDYGVCLVQLNRGDEALVAFQKSLVIDPTLYAARLGLGAAYNLQNNIQAATDVFEALVEEFPDQPDAYNNLATMYKKAGRLEDAARVLQAAKKLPLKSP